MPFVSIVLIAFNDEKHVENAIESLRQQTLQDIEIICVDDGSGDRTLEIMMQAASCDERVKVFTQPNNGCFSARFAGLQKASGEYVMFIDSDDALSPEAAETLLREARRTHADVLECGVELVVDETDLATKPWVQNSFCFLSSFFSPDRPIPTEKNGESLIDACFADHSITWSIWNKLFKTALVKEAWQFYQGEYVALLDDILEMLMILSLAECYARIDAKLYHYSVGIGISTTGDKIISSDHAKRYGMQALLLRLQREWMEKLPVKPENCDAGIAAFRSIVRDSLFQALYFRCDFSKRDEMLEWIRECISEEELCRELLTFTFENYHASLMASLNEKDTSLSVMSQKLEACQHENSDLNLQLDQAKEAFQKTVNDLSQELEVCRHENADLSLQLAATQNAFNEINNAFFWRLTKPARMTLDAIKAIIAKVG